MGGPCRGPATTTTAVGRRPAGGSRLPKQSSMRSWPAEPAGEPSAEATPPTRGEAARGARPPGARRGFRVPPGPRSRAEGPRARERAPGGTRKRRAPARQGLRGKRRARPRGPRREESRRPEPSPGAGTLLRRLRAAARRREGASEREGARQPLGPERPSEVGAAGRALRSGPGEKGRGARPGGGLAPRPPSRTAGPRRRHRSPAGRQPSWLLAG